MMDCYLLICISEQPARVNGSQGGNITSIQLSIVDEYMLERKTSTYNRYLDLEEAQHGPDGLEPSSNFGF